MAVRICPYGQTHVRIQHQCDEPLHRHLESGYRARFQFAKQYRGGSSQRRVTGESVVPVEFHDGPELAERNGHVGPVDARRQCEPTCALDRRPAPEPHHDRTGAIHVGHYGCCLSRSSRAPTPPIQTSRYGAPILTSQAFIIAPGTTRTKRSPQASPAASTSRRV
jgi:hypothetical protein